MKGIVLLSHGPMAKGIFETTKWFMGVDIPQYGYLCLEPDDIIEDYDKKISSLIEDVDTGEGVVLFTDLFGGTPCNRCVQFMSNNLDIIAGMNLSIVLEQLGNRLSDSYDFEALVETGRSGIVHLNTMNVGKGDNFLD
ncbi:hypothetical protein SDC9_81948 [bioreactor metagenome]|uniref:PTS EIIA type-4 domain-containing protein n=1 Tax=bioreactor metagenome TaxID=1076179 RepID=A0A644Z420_9ZZZZ|nr:PTS sugar transporter subunit IIA [Erysipelotrichaceae bacterium]